MSLQAWAEKLCRATAPRDIVELHAQDAIAASLAGRRTRDGAALEALYRDRGELTASIAAAAIARASESDDIHLASCVTPGSAVTFVAVTFAKGDAAKKASAMAAGYAAGITLGLAIGGARALANGVWPTLLAAPLMAAVAASITRGHDAKILGPAMALALAGSNGKAGRPAGEPSGRWFLFAEAVARGVAASDAAAQGFRGDPDLLSKSWLSAQAGHDGIDMDVFEAPLPSMSEVEFKPFAIARQGLNAVTAFQRVLKNGVDPKRIESIDVSVPAMNVALLTRPVTGEDRLSRLCNMGFQLACAAFAPECLYDPDRVATPSLLEFAKRVTVAAAKDLETYLPHHWAARVVVKAGQQSFTEVLIRNEFDSNAPDFAARLQDKWNRMLPEMNDAITSAGLKVWR
jgi:2-methylcitrate dehydratase PrpD